MLVNKQELADILKVSQPTLNSLLRRHPGFPVEVEGSNGVEWQFDVERVVEFMREQDELERREIEARSEALKQWRLPIDDAASQTPGVSPQQELALARTALARHKLAIESGHLVPTTTVRLAAQTAFGTLGPALLRIPDQVGRQHNLPEDVVQSIRLQIEDLVRRSVAETERSLREKAGQLAAASAA